MATSALSDAWFLLRARLTGSRVGIAIGWFYGAKPELVYISIRLGYVEEHSECSLKFMGWGRDHEDDSLYSIESVFDVIVFESPFAIDDRFPWIGSTPDAYIKKSPFDGKPIIVESKCPGKPYKTPPPYYIAQVYVEMRTYGTKRAYFTCWTPKHIKIWMILWDDPFWVHMFVLLMNFWDCVMSKTVPNSYIIPDVGQAINEWAENDYSHTSRIEVVKKYHLEDWKTHIFVNFTCRS